MRSWRLALGAQSAGRPELQVARHYFASMGVGFFVCGLAGVIVGLIRVMENLDRPALDELSAAEQAFERHRQAQSAPRLITRKLRDALVDVGTCLKTIWGDGVITREQQKALLRSLVDKVVLDRVAPDLTRLRIVWKGGAVTDAAVPMNTGSFAGLTNAQDFERLALAMVGDGYSDADIAQKLTLKGFRSPRAGKVLPSTVQILRYKRGILRRVAVPPDRWTEIVGRQHAAAKHDIQLECVPESQLEALVAPVKTSYGKPIFSPSSIPHAGVGDDIDEMDRESAKQMIPDTYAPCWCASGKKFKFCCKPILREIIGAMAYAEEGRKDEALKQIAEAKRIAGETPEVLCREALVWTHFDSAKATALLDKSLAANPNHPRANYVRGIDLKTKGDFAGAIAAYSRTIESYPKTDRFHLNETYNNLGNTYFESGEAAKAKAAWEQALILMPSDKTVRRNLAEFIYTNPSLPAAERTPSPFVSKFFVL